MFFNRDNQSHYSAIILVFCCSYIVSPHVYSEHEHSGLFVSPNKCVALNKGRECYAKANIVWRTKTPGFYCITIDADSAPLKCWRDVRQGKVVYEMSSKQDVTIVLHAKEGDKHIAKTVIEISWLYAGDNRKRRWRLF